VNGIRSRRIVAAAAATLGLLAWSGTALAKAPPPKAKDLSAISQYRESIPTAGGETYPNTRPAETTPLPQAIEHKVEARGGSDAPALVKTATDSRLGAPEVLLPAIRSTPDRPSGAPNAVLSAAGNLVTDGQDGRIVGLVVVLAAIALAAGAAAALRRRGL
jgi:hypothetical protein